MKIVAFLSTLLAFSIGFGATSQSGKAVFIYTADNSPCTPLTENATDPNGNKLLEYEFLLAREKGKKMLWSVKSSSDGITQKFFFETQINKELVLTAKGFKGTYDTILFSQLLNIRADDKDKKKTRYNQTVIYSLAGKLVKEVAFACISQF